MLETKLLNDDELDSVNGGVASGNTVQSAFESAKTALSNLQSAAQNDLQKTYYGDLIACCESGIANSNNAAQVTEIVGNMDTIISQANDIPSRRIVAELKGKLGI
ncbi:MAG: hypothetical protein MJ236_06210 [Clostridia bacterium]|nr:hypothetical protein [Clostridia bacterium]